MDKRENMRDSLQAMSLVNSKERVQGFGIFLTPDVCQTGGRNGSFISQASTQTSRGKWPSLSDALESSGRHGEEGAS